MNVNAFVSQTQTTSSSLGTRSEFQYITPSICETLKLRLPHVTTPSRCSCHVRRQPLPPLTMTPTNTSRSTRPALREGTPRRRSASHVSGPIIRRSLCDALALTACDRLGAEIIVENRSRRHVSLPHIEALRALRDRMEHLNTPWTAVWMYTSKDREEQFEIIRKRR
jgi:hypothetical protein